MKSLLIMAALSVAALIGFLLVALETCGKHMNE